MEVLEEALPGNLSRADIDIAKFILSSNRSRGPHIFEASFASSEHLKKHEVHLKTLEANAGKPQ